MTERAAPRRRIPPPTQLFFGPVFQRDMRALGRRRSTYAVRFLFTTGLIGLALLIGGSIAANAQGSGSLARQQALQEIAPALTLTVGWFGFIALCFASIVVAASAICDERHKRTLPALMTTPITAAEMVFSMLASRFVQITILALAGLPVLLAARTFGGAPLRTVIAFAAISLSVSLLGISIALLASVGARRASTAASMAFTILNIIFFGPLLLLFLGQFGAVPTNRLLELFTIISAPTAAMATTADLMGGGFTGNINAVWIGNTLFNIALALVMASFASASLRKRIRCDNEASTPTKRTRRSLRRATPTPDASPDLAAMSGEASPSPKRAKRQARAAARAAKRSGARTVPDAALLWRELRQRATSRAFATTVISAMLLALAIFPWRLGVDEETTYFLPALFASFLICFLAGNTPAASIAGERESRTWDTLLTTRIPRRELIASKYLGILSRQWLTPLAIAVYLGLIGTTTGHIHPIAPLHYLAIILGPVLLFSATGLALSLVSKTPTRAATINIALVLILYAALPMLVALLADFFGETVDVIDLIEEPFLLTHPVPSAILALDFGFSSRGGSFSRTQDIADLDVTRAQYTMLIAVVLAVHAALAAAVLTATTLLFNRLAPRSS